VFIFSIFIEFLDLFGEAELTPAGWSSILCLVIRVWMVAGEHAARWRWLTYMPPVASPDGFRACFFVPTNIFVSAGTTHG
jgi:hypothetical protein